MSSLFANHHHLAEFLIRLGQSTVLLFLLVAIFAPLEHFFALRPVGLFHKGWKVDLGWYFVNGLAVTFLLGPPAALIGWGLHWLLPEQITQAGTELPLWARMIAAMLVGDLGFYWGHRWSHEIPLLWRFHAVHHSATEVNFLVNTRAHPFDMVFTRLCGLTLLFATGLADAAGPNPTLIPAMVLFVGSMWSFFIHANIRLRLGWFENVMASPAFHHWHHTFEDHKDHNYAPMLPVMDRIFGTLYLPKEWPEAYGTATPMPDNLVGQLLDPFAPAEAPATKLSV